MDTIKIINFIIMIVFFAYYAYQFFYVPVAWLGKPKKPPVSGKWHNIAVLIAARNEEPVIGNLIDSLKEQTYPSQLLTVYVVADNCTDRTAQVAREHGAVVYERFNRQQVGKGYALHFLLEQIPTEYDAYLVFDADNIVDRHYVEEINKTFSAGYEVVTSYLHAKNYGDNWITAGYGLWFLKDA